MPWALYVLILAWTQPAPLDTDGFNYLRMFHALTHRHPFPLQATVPKPLLVFLFGGVFQVFSFPGLYLLEILAVGGLMLGCAYSFRRKTWGPPFALSLGLALVALPYFFTKLWLNNSTLYALLFLVWGLALLMEKRYALAAFFLLLGGLVRPEVWGAAGWIGWMETLRQKRSPQLLWLLLPLTAPLLWMGFDAWLTRDPLYSKHAVAVYMKQLGIQPLAVADGHRALRIILQWVDFLQEFVVWTTASGLLLFFWHWVHDREIRRYVTLWLDVMVGTGLYLVMVLLWSGFWLERLWFGWIVALVVFSTAFLWALGRRSRRFQVWWLPMGMVLLLIFQTFWQPRDLPGALQTLRREGRLFRTAQHLPTPLGNLGEWRHMLVPGRRLGLVLAVVDFELEPKLIGLRGFLRLPEEVRDTLHPEYLLHFPGDYLQGAEVLRQLDRPRASHRLRLSSSKEMLAVLRWVSPDTLCLLYRLEPVTPGDTVPVPGGPAQRP